MYTSNKCLWIDNVSNTYFWHYRLGHINKNKVNRLTQERILEVNDYELLPTCKTCLLRKMMKSSFTKKDDRASEVLSLVHIDVCGPMNTSVRDGYYYFITFIDDLSRYVYVYLMKYKSELFEIFK